MTAGRLEDPAGSGVADPRALQRAIVWTALGTVFCLSALNAIYWTIQFAFDGPIGFYLPRGDLLGDFLKVVLSYPGADRVPISTELARGYLGNAYGDGSEALLAGKLTHFHLPPLTTVLSLLTVKLMSLVGAEPAFLVIVTALAAWFALLAREVVDDGLDGLALSLCVFVSYPFLFMLQRGNVFSALAVLLVSHALVQLRKGRSALPALLLLALAINLRPNLALMAAPALVWAPRRIRGALLLAASTGVVFAVCLRVASAWYPAYSMRTFARGLAVYHELYVLGDGGLAYSTSLYTLVKFAMLQAGVGRETLPVVELACSALAVLVAAVATWGRLRGRLGDCALVFVLTAAGMLGTAVYADYHLLLFVTPLLVLLLEARDDPAAPRRTAELDRTVLVVLAACCFLLAPKNFVGVGTVWVSAFSNTIVCLLVVGYLVVASLARSRTPPECGIAAPG